jgi:hypothetical protein
MPCGKLDPVASDVFLTSAEIESSDVLDEVIEMSVAILTMQFGEAGRFVIAADVRW